MSDPTSALELATLVVFDWRTQVIPPITWERYISSWMFGEDGIMGRREFRDDKDGG